MGHRGADEAPHCQRKRATRLAEEEFVPSPDAGGSRREAGEQQRDLAHVCRGVDGTPASRVRQGAERFSVATA